MPTQRTSAASGSRRIVHALLYAATLSWMLPSHADEKHRVVYRCLRDDVLTLTDVPCDGERVDIDLQRNLSSARPAATATREKLRKPQQQRSTDTDEKELKEQQAHCRRLRAQLRTLQSKLRSGYTAVAGIRMEERKRHLREQAQAAKCP